MTLENKMSWPELCNYTIDRCLAKRLLKPSQAADFRKFMMSRAKIGYCFDHISILRAYFIYRELCQGLDHFVVMSGREGLGKSTLSMQLAAWVDPSFTEDSIVYGAADYIAKMREKLDKFKAMKKMQITALVLDEGTELLSKESLNLTNRILTKTFFVQRALRFLIIVNIPNFFMLDGVIRNHRAQTLMEVMRRGRVKGFNARGLRIVAKQGMLHKDVQAVKVPEGLWWESDFRKQPPQTIDWETYEQQKLDGISRLLEDLQGVATPKKYIALTDAAEKLGMHRKVLVRMLQKGKIQGKKIGKMYYVTRKAFKSLSDVHEGRNGSA